MVNIKGAFFVLFLFSIMSLSFAYADRVYISTQPMVSTIINDHNVPAVYKVTLTNNGAGSIFDIYTFEKFRLNPSEINLSAGETQTVSLQFFPISSMVDNSGYVSVPFFVRDQTNVNGQGDSSTVVIKLVSFANAFDVGGENVNLDADAMKVYFYNKENVHYKGINMVFSSNFFEDSPQTFDLNPYQKYEITIPINRDKIKKLVAGTYTVSATVTLDNKTVVIPGQIKILEQTGLSEKDSSSGFVIRTDTIAKTNDGNIPTVAEITIQKDIISRLFTTFSLEPSRVERNGFLVVYTWQKELNPDETLSVDATTNWTFPLLLVIAVIIIGYMFNRFTKQNLVIHKSVGFVRTKTNDFALRVTIRVKARKFMEKVVIYDRLPGIAKLYERFGEKPTRFDEQSGRMQWEIPRLTEGEERVYSYVFYSKINVIGKFELPSATGLYEINGKLNETRSNRAFFINETASVKPDKTEKEFRDFK